MKRRKEREGEREAGRQEARNKENTTLTARTVRHPNKTEKLSRSLL